MDRHAEKRRSHRRQRLDACHATTGNAVAGVRRAGGEGCQAERCAPPAVWRSAARWPVPRGRRPRSTGRSRRASCFPHLAPYFPEIPVPDIVVFGSINADLVLEVPALPGPGETVLGGRLRVLSGGKGANQAVAAASAAAAPDEATGPVVRMVGRIGDDAHGRRMRADLVEAGVDDSAVTIDATEPSGTALVFVDRAGENLIAVAPGANARLDETDVARVGTVLRPRDVVLCQLEVPLPAVRALLTVAAAAGARTVCNAAPATPLDPGLLAALDVLVVNESEAQVVRGAVIRTPEEAVRAAAEIGCSVVVTLGAAGAVYAEPTGGSGHCPAPDVEVVDTVGAGDAFVGALAVALARGAALAEAVQAGVTAGAAAVTRSGARPTRPDGDDGRRPADRQGNLEPRLPY
ncbi:ribokinase [Micromonospora sp. URMC 103]|uniref:ribokinase n=1 Tax=Micromonospora sp. URMC 103 TaxID=3423406 RepID=UPI003F1AEE03